MKLFQFILIPLVACASLHCAKNNFPDTDEDAQSPSRPFGLEPVAPTQRWEAATDPYSLDIQNYFLPFFDNVDPNDPQAADAYNSGNLDINALLNAGAADITSSVNPFSIQPNEPSNLRVYFVDEQTPKQNTLGWFNAQGIQNRNDYENIFQEGNPQLVFPNTTYNPNAGRGRHSDSQPLKPFDYVDIGTFDMGDDINFFVIEGSGTGNLDKKDIDDNGVQLWGTNSLYDIVTQNSPHDNFYHFKYYSLPGRSEILVAFENTLPTDGDFNDLFFLVQMATVPEPSTYFLIGFLLSVMASMTRLIKEKPNLERRKS